MHISLMLAAFASAAHLQNPPRTQPGEIVVTGQRTLATEEALRQCLARGCSPVEDINASIAHAENLLLGGDYRGARRVLGHSIDRNHDETRRHPEPLADLYRANALVASHLGMDRDFKQSTYEVYRTLKVGIPTMDYRHLQAKMEIAAMTAKVEGHERGERAYMAVARDAEAMGRNDIAGIAKIRAAMQVYKLAPAAGKARLQNLIKQADQFVSPHAKLVYAQALWLEGRADQANSILADLFQGSEKPILVYSPQIQLAEQEPVEPAGAPYSQIDAELRRPSRNFERKWINVAFFVQPDGSVSDVEIVRSENDVFWAAPLLRSIKNRRYAPRSGNLPYPKLERYTYTAAYDTVSGTRLAVRSPKARIEVVDLTLPERSTR